MLKKIVLFISLAPFGYLYADGKIDCQKHLPNEIYQYLLDKKGLDGEVISFTTEKERIEMTLKNDSKEGDYLDILYFPPENEFDVVRIEIIFREKKLIIYAAFDCDGRDYLPESPEISQEDEEMMQEFLLEEVFPRFF